MASTLILVSVHCISCPLFCPFTFSVSSLPLPPLLLTSLDVRHEAVNEKLQGGVTTICGVGSKIHPYVRSEAIEEAIDGGVLQAQIEWCMISIGVWGTATM